MIGFVITSHGLLAEGAKNTLEMFFGENIENVEFICLSKDKSVEAFRAELEESIRKVDSNDGVIIFSDIRSGTPYNQAIQLTNDKIKVVSGWNLPMLMESLVDRYSKDSIENYDIDEVCLKTKESIELFKGIDNGSQSDEEL